MSPDMDKVVGAMARAVREEIVRQYRDQDRKKFPTGSHDWEETQQPWLIARAAIAAARDAGYVLAPVVATEEMLEAGGLGIVDDRPTQEVWAAMIAAAEPKP